MAEPILPFPLDVDQSYTFGLTSSIFHCLDLTGFHISLAVLVSAEHCHYYIFRSPQTTILHFLRFSAFF